MVIGEVIKMIMKKRGMTQKSLAEKIPLTQPALSMIISGENYAHDSTLQKIAKALGVPVSAMLFLCVKESDVPEENRQLFRTLQPTMEQWVMDIFTVGKK